jgi:predicted RND superfamily exporter protein
MHNLLPFLKWLMRKWFGGTGRLHQSYEKNVIRDPLPFFFLTILIYAVIWMLITLLLIGLAVAVTTIYAVWIVLAVAVFGNYFRILIKEQYRRFCQEQQKLFEKIKNT